MTDIPPDQSVPLPPFSPPPNLGYMRGGRGASNLIAGDVDRIVNQAASPAPSESSASGGQAWKIGRGAVSQSLSTMPSPSGPPHPS